MAVGTMVVTVDAFPDPQDGSQTVAVPGTAEALVDVPTPFQCLMVQAMESNTGTVMLGGSNVVAANDKSEVGIKLVPLAMIVLSKSDLYEWYIDAENAGDGVTFTYSARV